MKIRIALLLVALMVGFRAAGAELDVRFDQRIGEQLPLGQAFTDENGRTQPLGLFLGGKPAVLVFNYLRCPEMCSLVSGGMIDALRQLRPTVGRDFDVLSVSIDPGDTPDMARTHQRADVQHYGRAGASSGWHELVGSPGSIRALTDAAGFHFAYDPRSQQFAHPTGIILVTPTGRVSSYFLGVDYPAAQVASALRRAARNKTGSSVFSLLFICFQGGTPEGRYGSLIWSLLSVSVALTVVGVFGGILWMLRNERRVGGGRTA